MLVVSTQPRTFCPLSKTYPLLYQISTDEHIIDPGSFPNFSVTIESTPAANGETITLAGQTFSVANGLPESFQTFRADGTKQDIAESLLLALQKNFNFQDYQLFTTSSGGDWTVNAFKFTAEEIDNWTFGSTLTIAHTIDETNGQPVELRNMRIWYRLYRQGEPVTGIMAVDIPFDPLSPFFSIVEFDVLDQARPTVRAKIPSYNLVTPATDVLFSDVLHVRFGLVEYDANCNQIYSDSFITSEFVFTNSIFQYFYAFEFLPHCPNGGAALIRFLSDRPAFSTVCYGTYEWIKIWVEQSAKFEGAFLVRYIFYDSNGAVLNTIDYPISSTRVVYDIDLGPENLRVSPYITDDVYRYTVQVIAEGLDAGDNLVEIPYSELLQRRLVDCNCKAAEVYFLEDNGSFRTLIFEKIDQRLFEQVIREYESKLQYHDFTGIGGSLQQLVDGGRYSEAAEADNVFVLTTETLNIENRQLYEQLLRSPLTLIKSRTNGGTTVIRRVIFDRGSQRTFQDGEAIRLLISFRFNTKTVVH